MADREKVIYSIERCICHVPDACRDCGYDNHEYNECVEKLLRDALDLLKEQEPVTPITTGKGILDRTRCGACGSEIANSHFYCWYCGRKVKWDAVGESSER